MALLAPSSPSVIPKALQTVMVPMPGGGAKLVVSSSPGGQLHLGFDPGRATVSRQGSDLVFELEDGSEVVIASFFAVGNFGFPALRLPDGSLVAGMDFFSGHDIDLTPAAGPRPASGGTNYEDDPGELVSGLDRLEALEPSAWDRETQAAPSAGGGNAPGNEVFPFAVLEEGSQREILVDLSPPEEALRLELLIDGREADLLTEQLQASLGEARNDPALVSVDSVTEEGLSLNISGHSVEVRFEDGGRLNEEQMLALQSDDAQNQIEALKLLFATTG
ncbi:MAG: hypothetical protein LBJ82_01590 [Deltaproteobacteria bacterium]|jgi:hypothetical protein|nr:hypothetical protein [Deltaproteobacteria bacterium]